MQEYIEFVEDKKIHQTLVFLTKQKETIPTLRAILGENITEKPIKIMFFDLSSMNQSYKKLDALTCQRNNGSLYIFINTIHREAPIEAIACLLAHEVIHQDNYESIAEEIQGWTAEAKTWKKLRRKCKEAKNNDIPLIARLNTIYKLYKKGNIPEAIRTNLAYKDLPEN